MVLPPPVPPKSKISHVNNENVDSSGGFSVSAAKALFEAAKKPEVRNAAIAAAKNPFVRQTARTVAQDEKARGAVLNAVKNPSASNKFSAAFAVADANKKMGSSVASPSPPPPPPPHRTLSSASEVTTNRSLPGKLSTTHSQIRSQLENLHLGGTNAFRENDKPSKIITSYQNSTSTSSYSQPPPRPPPLPHLSYNSSNSYNTPVQNSSYNNSGFNSISQINEPHGIAQYTYSAVQPDELSLNVGDIIILKRIVDDQWFYGENKSNGLTGIVPKAYLQIKIPLSEPQPTLNYSNTSSGSQIYAIALYDYDSAQPGDLTFRMNKTIVVTKKINNEWLEGEVDGRKGIFPANFVDCPKIHEVPTKSLYQFNQTTNVNMEKVTAAFDYFSGVEADLSFKQGDTIYVVEHIDADWLMGELNGRRGLVPKTFLGSPFGSPKKSPKGLAEISTAFSPKKAIAIADYHSDDQKHLYVTRGDNILIVEDVDEYYYKGKLEIFKTLPAGILPKNVVKLVN